MPLLQGTIHHRHDASFTAAQALRAQLQCEPQCGQGFREAVIGGHSGPLFGGSAVFGGSGIFGGSVSFGAIAFWQEHSGEGYRNLDPARFGAWHQ